MNINQILAILKIYGITDVQNQIVGPLAVQIIANPGITDEQLTSDEDGSLKHFVRGKVGWAVDIIWPFIHTYVDQIITTAIPQARAIAGLGTVPGVSA